MKCEGCFHHCELGEGQIGFCRGRRMEQGHIVSANYGRLTSIALDPIEKKPLRRFFPGSRILSVGSFGCNLRCPFCQNHSIAQAGSREIETSFVSPKELTSLAADLKDQGNIGVAFTYNEPLIGWEYVRDTGRLMHKEGMKTVVVTNGTAELSVMEELWPCIDAMNIDLKSMRKDCYRERLKGNLSMVKDLIGEAAKHCHVELTTLIVPGMNDSEEEMREEAAWIASIDPQIPLHVTRFFPRYRMANQKPTPVSMVYHLADIARTSLAYVYEGNC